MLTLTCSFEIFVAAINFNSLNHGHLLVYNGRYIPNKNEELSGSKLCYESRSYLVTKAAQNLDHIC